MYSYPRMHPCHYPQSMYSRSQTDVRLYSIDVCVCVRSSPSLFLSLTVYLLKGRKSKGTTRSSNDIAKLASGSVPRRTGLVCCSSHNPLYELVLFTLTSLTSTDSPTGIRAGEAHSREL